MQTAEVMKGFEQYLVCEEREKATVEKYLREAEGFLLWLGKRKLTKEESVAWKEMLAGKRYTPVTVNGKLRP